MLDTVKQGGGLAWQDESYFLRAKLKYGLMKLRSLQNWTIDINQIRSTNKTIIARPKVSYRLLKAYSENSLKKGLYQSACRIGMISQNRQDDQQF